MKSKTMNRYWMEFYHYEQWLIDNSYVSSKKCYSSTNRIKTEYITKLSGYVQMMKKRYKKTTVRAKVSRLTRCLSSISGNKRKLLIETCSYIRSGKLIVTYKYIRITRRIIIVT